MYTEWDRGQRPQLQWLSLLLQIIDASIKNIFSHFSVTWRGYNQGASVYLLATFKGVFYRSFIHLINMMGTYF